MIIGYYHQIFFGGGTYYKLSKKENDEKYKFEYCHSTIPNYISEAEKYIQKYDTLKIEGRFQEDFKGMINVVYLDLTPEIKRIIDIFNNANWVKIAKKEYTSDSLDDVCWEFYNRTTIYNTHYLIKGYSVYPKEIEEIYTIFGKMKEKYIKKEANYN